MLESTDKVCGPYVVTLVAHTHVFEWYALRLIVKVVHQKHTCYDEIELSFSNISTFDSQRVHFHELRIFIPPFLSRAIQPTIIITNTYL